MWRARSGGAFVVSWLALTIAACPAIAASDNALDQCSVIVTGTDARSREDGLRACLVRVLVKVAADPSIADDPKLASAASDPARLLEDFVYLDRMSDQALHDEQGTRDRPFDLIARFKPDAVDAAIRALGRSPWRGERPPLVVLATIAPWSGGRFPISADAPETERQRRSLLAAGIQFGMRIVLLPAAAMTDEGAARVDLAALPMGGVGNGAVLLSGTLVWSPADHGYVASWSIRTGTRERLWTVRGVSFDDAFRAGVSGAAARLARANSRR